MAFNVTQCPTCESTFNTSARTLGTAAGRVRCGACLTVFDAAKHYIEQVDSDSGYPEGESVFVGNNPEEFFDPSEFLTRSALTEIDEENDAEELEPSNEELFGAEELHVGFEHADNFDNELVEIGLVDTLNDEELNGESLTAKEIREEERVETPSTEKAASPDQLIDTGNTSISEPDQLQSNIPLEPDIEQIPASTPEPPAQDQWSMEQEHVETNFPNWEAAPAPRWEILPDHEKEPADPITLEDDILPDVADPQPAGQQAQNQHAEPALDTAIDSEPDIPQENIDDQPGSPILDWPALDSSITESETAQQAGNVPSVASEPAHEDEHPADVKSQFVTEPLTEFEKTEPGIGENNNEDLTDLPGTEESAELSTAAIRARVQEAELEDEEALEALPQENLVALGEMSAPLELPLHSKSRWGQGIAFSLLIILLGASLAAQYLWRGIDVYSQHAGIRPFYELVCKTLSCQVPAYSEIAAIRSDSLVVRSHPQLANGLVINTTIRNTANFPQAFPIMVLSFNSASNDIVALRELAPAEYLSPGLQSFSSMPVMTPVQIDLEIIDPGPDAVNYTLAFRLP